MYKHLIFKDHPAGFYSNFNKVVQNLSAHFNDIKKITWQMRTYHFSSYNCDEIFSNLFEEYNQQEPNDILEDIEIDRYIDYGFTAHTAVNVYQNSDQSWRTEYNKAFKRYIKFTNFLNQLWTDTFEIGFNKDRVHIGVLLRNNALSTEQPNRRLPSITQYFDAIDSLNIANPKIICSIDNLEELTPFTNNYDCWYNKNTLRTTYKNEAEPHVTNDKTIKDAANQFLEGYMLSKCDYLIHPVSNIATGALYMNPDLKNIFLVG